MLFKTRFHAGIRDGSIRVTFRRWKRAQVKRGGRYRVGAEEIIEVERIGSISIASLTPEDARAAGFDSLDELRSMLGWAEGRAADDLAYRVDFRHIGKWCDETGADDAELTAA